MGYGQISQNTWAQWQKKVQTKYYFRLLAPLTDLTPSLVLNEMNSIDYDTYFKLN